MHAGIALGRWVLLVHCASSVGKTLSQKSGSREPGKSTVTASISISLTVDGPWQKGEGCGERQ